MEDAPFDAVASAILVLMTRALDWDTWSASMANHAADAVVTAVTWDPISRERHVVEAMVLSFYGLMAQEAFTPTMEVILVLIAQERTRT